VVGSRTRAKVVKNKVAAPFREAEFDIIYGEGVSREGDLLDLGVMKGILEKSGTWLSYKGERIGQGRENARLFLRENADFREKIEQELRKALGLPTMHQEETGKSAESKAAGESSKTVSMAAAAAAKGRTTR
jgi:recombination protein RecA